MLNKIFIHFKKIDWTLVFVPILLTLIGLFSIYSSSLFEGDFLNFRKQIVFLVFGIFLMFVFSFLDWRIFKENPYLILVLYFLHLLALSFLLFFGPLIKGTKSWFKIGVITIDPIESLKIILLLLLAKYFSARHVEMYKISHILISSIYVLIPSFLISLQPNLGSALILVLLWIGILIVSGIEVKHFLILVLVFLFVFAFSWTHFLKDYQKARIMSFVAPNVDPLGMGWSQLQSKIAIGSGGLFGKGWRKGSQVQFGFLTAPQTDFIFAAIAEEFGLFGVFVLLALFAFLLFQIAKTSFQFRTNFSRLFALGFSILLFLQAFIHIGMNLGILPIIGISLPLVSYGGSGLISNYISLGILQSLKIHKD